MYRREELAPGSDDSTIERNTLVTTLSSSVSHILRAPMLALLACVAIVGSANAQGASPSPSRPTLANPASQNCTDKGGTLSFQRSGKGGQFGVCIFPDNLQCEEWAMMRGECRTGGIKVTGYVTPAARYCAITGGKYEVTSASNTPSERSACTFANGKRCDARAYFNAACSRQSAGPTKTSAAKPAPAPPNTIVARFVCSDGKSIEARFVHRPRSRVELVLSDGRRLTLPQARSGSGARYANSDESVVFWNVGSTATLSEKRKTTYAGCATKR